MSCVELVRQRGRERKSCICKEVRGNGVGVCRGERMKGEGVDFPVCIQGMRL